MYAFIDKRDLGTLKNAEGKTLTDRWRLTAQARQNKKWNEVPEKCVGPTPQYIQEKKQKGWMWMKELHLVLQKLTDKLVSTRTCVRFQDILASKTDLCPHETI